MSKKSRILPIFILFLLAAGLALGSQLTNFSRSFEVSGTPKLVASLGAGDILVNPVEGVRTIQVDVVAIDQQDLSYLEVRQEGNTVYVDFRPQGRNNRRAPRFEFTVPDAASLDLTTAGGDIHFAANTRGDVQAKTAGGDIVLADVQGTLNATTAGGDIQAGVVSNDCTLSTAGGDIRLKAADGDVDVKTAGGDIHVGDVGKQLKASTSGGDIRLGNVAGSAVASTAGGDITVESVDGSADLKTAGGDITLAGARGEVQAATAGGDLNLDQVEGAISASTAGGDITAQLLTAAPDSSLKTAGGNIELQIAPSARVTVMAIVHVKGSWSREGRDFGIESGFGPVQVESDQSTAELRARIPVNGGGVEVLCETSNGWIRVVPLR
jgi:DUF4097 and DUF4098 domain-containing protein YvlB